MYSDNSDSDTESVTSQASSNAGGNKKGRGRRKPNSQGNRPKTQSASRQSPVKDFILQRGGTVSLGELLQQSFYPETEEKDVEEWLRDEPGRYLVKRNIKGKVQTVTAIVKVRLCYDFTHSKCKFGNGCTNVHICKDFLEGNCCNSGGTCQFPHNFQSEQNKKVVKGMGLDGLLDDKIVKVIRGSLPKICKFYNSANGCRDNTLCTNLHICNNYIQESCKGDCKLSHNFADPHNDRVLQKHFMISKMPEHILKYSTMLVLFATKRSEAAVPVSRGRGRGRGRGGRGAANRARSTENLSLASTSSSSQHCSTENLEKAGRKAGGRGRSSSGRGGRVNFGRRTSEEVSPATEVEPTSIKPPSETYVFKSICCQYNGKVLFDSIWLNEFSPLGLDKTQTTSWFRKRPNKFQIYETADGNLEVSVILPKARLCFGHTMKSGCQKGDQCQFFHVCRNLIQGSCKHGSNCKFVHDLQSEQARRVVHELQLDCLTDDQIINVIRNSTPRVCEAYISHSCLKADRCRDVHVCAEFVRGRCNEDACDLNHESCFDTPQTRKVLSDFRMANTDQRAVIKTLLIPPTITVKARPYVPKTLQTPTKNLAANTATTSTPQPNISQVVKPKVTSPPATLQPNTPPPAQVVQPKAKAPDPNEERILDGDTTICEDFLAGRCLKSRLCGHHHIKMPYLWQYQDSRSQGGVWTSFSPEVTTKMEEVFSKPSNITFNLLDIETRLYGWTVHFDRMELEISDSYPSKRVRIRRLSTPSSVESTSGEWATTWMWYYEGNGGSWCEYGKSVKPGTTAFITSDDIEQAYITKQPSYKFQTNEYPYTLDFTGMYQQNLDTRYSTKRNVRRRPKFVQFHSASNTRTNLAASQPSAVTRGSLPTTWKPMSQKEAFIRVKLAPTDAEFREVEKLFRKTMREDMIILEVERVQNPRLWEKYSMNKQQMIQKSMETRYGRTRTHNGNPYEFRKLFHGTDPDIIKGICHQNFDHRLSGKNATLYGKGSYFAKDASYSHRYSQASSDGTRYMFLADVLVGMYTRGKPDIPRPPPINPSDPNGDLYDSCVDNESNPSIFVVFKDDQCYPAYLINYADLTAIEVLDPLAGYLGSNYSSPSSSTYSTHGYRQGPSTTSTPTRQSSYSAHGRQATSTSTPTRQSFYSGYGRQGSAQPSSATSSPTRQSASSTSYPSSYGVQSPSSRYTSSTSYRFSMGNTPTRPASQQSSSSSGSENKTSCTIQ
ncbi:uncharacterized protein LOC144928883 [Branchiostoma floridae x Branchiostoma belcheri]